VRYSPIAGLSDEEMKLLMKDAVDKTYRFLRMLLDDWMEVGWAGPPDACSRLSRARTRWDWGLSRL